jgi:hypothetical protein
MTDAAPKTNSHGHGGAYACCLVVAVVLAFTVPSAARIIAIAGWLLVWAVLNTVSKNWGGCFGAWTSFLIFLITVLASWVNNGTMSQSHVQDSKQIRYAIRQTLSGLDGFHKEYERYPDSLKSFQKYYPQVQDFAVDPWGRPLLYTVNKDSFHIGSLGRDGVSGGVGLDADWFYDSTTRFDAGPWPFVPDMPLPLQQFVFNTPSSSSIPLGAVPLCLIAGYTVRKESQGVTKITRSIIFKVGTVTLIAAVISTYLAAFHIALSQAGH